MEGAPSGLTRNPIAIVGLVIFLIGFVVFAFEGFASVNTFPTSPGFPTGVLCGFGLAGLGMVVLIVSGLVARSAPIPPPPAIQQPMVPAGTIGPVALNCPACGAPAQAVDRFGVAVCPNCNTRFLVR